MKFLCIIHELARNGAVVCLLDAVRHLRAQDHQVTIYVNSPEGTSPDGLRPQFEEAGAKVTHRADGQPYDMAIVCTLLNFDWVNRLKGQLPVAWWIHEGIAVTAQFLDKPGLRHAFSGADQLIFPNPNADSMFEPLLGRVSIERRSIVPPAVRRVPGAAPQDRTPGVFRIVSVGSLCPRKQQSDLAASIAALDDLPLECVLIGEKSMIEDELSDLLAAHPTRIIAAGGLDADQVQAHYRIADLFCLPSRDEHFPMAPLEAGLHRLPILLSDLKCYRGVWSHGQTALLHPVGDRLLLQTYIRALFGTPELCRRLGMAAEDMARGYGLSRFEAAFDLAVEATLRGATDHAVASEPARGWRRFVPGQKRVGQHPSDPPPEIPASSLTVLPPPAPEIADLHARALSFASAGDPAKAADLLRQALIQSPGDLRCLAAATMVRTLLKHYAEAEELGRQAVRRGPLIPACHVNLGNCLFEQGRLEEALSSFIRALELQPDLPAALLNCAHCHIALGRIEAAIPYLASARSRASGDPAITAALAQVYAALGLTDEADACREEARKLDAASAVR